MLSVTLFIITKNKPAAINTTDDSVTETVSKTNPNQIQEPQKSYYEKALSDPVLLVSMGHQHPLIYIDVKKNLSEKDLPELYSLFEKHEYKDDWRYAAQLIGFVSDKGNKKSIDVLMDYLQRPDIWPSVGETKQAFNLGMGKSLCMEWIGMIGGDYAQEILLKALTLEGAQEIIKEYSKYADTYFPGGSKDLAASIRGRAAMGLVYCQSPEAISAVEQMYRQTTELSISDSKEYAVLLSEMKSAMYIKLVIDEIGLEQRYELYGYDSKLFTLISKYAN